MILNYQAIQDERWHLELRLENNLDDFRKSLLFKEIKKQFSDDINVKFVDGVDLKWIRFKKLEFVSELH